MDHGSDGDVESDSGYDIVRMPSEGGGPGMLVKSGGKYRVHTKALFVTYTQSRVEDAEEFHSCLRSSVAAHLDPKDRNDPEGFQVFGVKELHEDGSPHYHVVMKMRHLIQWRNAREKVRVWIERDGKRLVDTNAIHVKQKAQGEPMAKFLEDTQAYLMKEVGSTGVLFGTRIECASSRSGSDESKWAEVVQAPDADEAQRLIALFADKKDDGTRSASCALV
ncbi:hypothetical protein MRS44_017417 [Fusarium solani]|uniref:uncharacterized protein n=1 Tax=Fusarium solani TaxID=169388 RepID=UPI0032C3FF2D|nr:hypothetical protein MRS44_017417 [Fusarium solani]